MGLKKITNSILSRWKQFKYNVAVRKAKSDVEKMIKSGVLKRHSSGNSEFCTAYFTTEKKDPSR